MITIDNLYKKYKRKVIFEGLNTTFRDKSLTILLGENGAGKSTLLRMIAGLENQDEGYIFYNEQPLDKKHIHKILGYIPQDIALFEHMSVDDNIHLFKGLNQQVLDEDTINRYKKLLNLNETTALINTLSGGTKRKANLLIGLLGKPEIIILDEPTVGIDMKSRYDIHRLLNELKQHTLMIMTTHHMDEVEAIADEIKLIGKDPFYKEVLANSNLHFENILKTEDDNGTI